MKVWIVFDKDEIDTLVSIQGICATLESANILWNDFKCDRFHYGIKEYEVIE